MSEGEPKKPYEELADTELEREWFERGDVMNKVTEVVERRRGPYTAPEVKKQLIEEITNLIMKERKAAREAERLKRAKEEQEAIPMPEAEEEVKRREKEEKAPEEERERPYSKEV